MPLKKSELYSSLWAGCDELRGGMDASQYKDYVLILLFVKYVSDKYANDPMALIEIPHGGSFADMVAASGATQVFLCGPHMQALWQRLGAAQKAAWQPDSASLAQSFASAIRAGDVARAREIERNTVIGIASNGTRPGSRASGSSCHWNRLSLPSRSTTRLCAAMPARPPASTDARYAASAMVSSCTDLSK